VNNINESVAGTIRTYIAENILFTKDAYPYPDDASLLEEGILDSMNVMEMVAFLEEQFDLTVEDAEIIPDNFDSITRMAAYVAKKANEQEPHGKSAPSKNTNLSSSFHSA
jgi:acyl carrier protein